MFFVCVCVCVCVCPKRLSLCFLCSRMKRGLFYSWCVYMWVWGCEGVRVRKSVCCTNGRRSVPCVHACSAAFSTPGVGLCGYVCVHVRESVCVPQTAVALFLVFAHQARPSLLLVCVCIYVGAWVWGVVCVREREGVCVPQTAVALFFMFACQAQPPLLLVCVYVGAWVGGGVRVRVRVCVYVPQTAGALFLQFAHPALPPLLLMRV